MIAYKLEKEIHLYKMQFDEFMVNMFQDHRLDRASLEIDALLFRINYMKKHKKDLDKIPEIKQQFIQRASELRGIFGQFIIAFLNTYVTGINNRITDVLAQDVSIDPSYVKFKVIIISENQKVLTMIDDTISDGEIFNMFPDRYFRFYTDSYNDGIAKAYPELFKNHHKDDVGTGKDGDVFCHSLTFQTTESCNLNCTYCYQFNKSPMKMSFETAKRFIDKLLNDEYGYINRYNSPAIIIEFIGGEPFLAIKETRRIYEYFLDRCYELNHPWFTMHRVSICSNGLLYFDKDVQAFFKDYSHNISFNVSIDGNKELHDSCRIQPNGEGSYDIAMAAINHYNAKYSPERNSKMTLAPSNIKYLFESVVDFINNGMKSINLNCVFEKGWNLSTAKLEYEQLKKLADYILENDLHNIYLSIFNERQEDRSPKDNDGNWCGGTGSMLSIRPNGQLYPCIRYMPSSVGDNVKDLCIGTVSDGMVGRSEKSDILDMLDNITRRSQSNDICYDCPIANDCAACSALGHTVFGTPNKRCTFICLQTIAEALANVYYWNNLLMKHPEYNLLPRVLTVPDDWALIIIDKDELDMLKWLEVGARLIDLNKKIVSV